MYVHIYHSNINNTIWINFCLRSVFAFSEINPSDHDDKV